MSRTISSLVGEPLSQLNAEVTTAGAALAPTGDPGPVRAVADRAVGAAAAVAVLDNAELLCEPAHDRRALLRAQEALHAARTAALSLAAPAGSVEGIDAILRAITGALNTARTSSS
ncbi:hypothetical protein [Streptacidiphilus neutrinimicus]|uniref:hypothetical protein n=1 Tax=Streptacidiphilus neutrinimicus TaxID=105420 RepID=UPI0005AAAAFB|nr:hypothetical protein [Streptacidiphilus neutrinimicus]